MKRLIAGLAAAVMSIAVAGAASAADVAATPTGQENAFSVLSVGRTGILCYTEPCPWNGVVEGRAPRTPSSVIWSGAEPPLLLASAEDSSRIRDSYAEGCVLVEGRFAGVVLEVRRVIGDC